MSNTIERLKKDIAKKEALIKGKQTRINQFKVYYQQVVTVQTQYKKLYDKALAKALTEADRNKVTAVHQQYQTYTNQVTKLSAEISRLEQEVNTLRNEISAAKKELSQAMAKTYILTVASKEIVERTYSFDVVDDDNAWDDLLASNRIKIKFYKIHYAPAKKDFWLPKYIDITGGYHKSLSVAPKITRITIEGDTNNQITSSIYIVLQVGGIPQSQTTTANIGLEAGGEVKADISGKEGNLGAKLNLGLSKSWTNNFNGGSQDYVLDLRYDCMKGKPKIIQSNISVPSESDLKKVNSPASGIIDNFLWSEGDHDLKISNIKNNL